MKTNRVLLAGFFAMLAAMPALVVGQSGTAGKTGLAFLKVAMDGRGSALAEAHVADASGAAAIYWNPANLASSANEVFLAHAVWLQDISNNAVAVKFNALGRAWGIALQVQNIGGIQQRSRASLEPTGELSAHDIVFSLSHAWHLGSNLEAGVTLKYLSERLLDYSGTGLAFDTGFRLRFERLNHLAIAASIHNLGSMNGLGSENIDLPAYVRIGAAYQLLPATSLSQLRLLSSVTSQFQGGTRFGVAAEFVANNLAALRAGYQAGRESQNFSGGIGLNKGRFRLDYSYAPFQFDLGDTHRISIAISI